MSDADKVRLYGRCFVCGAPRDVVQQNKDGLVWLLVCTRDENHTEDW